VDHDAHAELVIALAFGPASSLEPGTRTTLFDLELPPQELLQLDEDELKEHGIPSSQRARLRSAAAHAQARELIETARARGLQVLHRGGPGWPERLDGLPAAPRVLFARGEISLLHEPRMLGIVGARVATPYGREACRAFVEALALAGWGTCSGLARGIDGEAHRATLTYDRPTIAVLGSGLENIYPEEHRGLAADILASGGAPAQRAAAWHPCAAHELFRGANRIIAALSAGVLVVEAARRSGALVTARWAELYGRPVWALPGPYNAAQSEGCNALIRDGAFLADGPSGLLQDLGFEQEELATQQAPGGDSSSNATRILQALAQGPRPVDLLASELELSFSKLLIELQRMSAAGWIVEQSGLWRRRR
jgi:DNA processing protein